MGVFQVCEVVCVVVYDGVYVYVDVGFVYYVEYLCQVLVWFVYEFIDGFVVFVEVEQCVGGVLVFKFVVQVCQYDVVIFVYVVVGIDVVVWYQKQ